MTNGVEGISQTALLNKIHTAVKVFANDMRYLKDDLVEIKSRLSSAEDRAEGALKGVEERLRKVEIIQEGMRTKLMLSGGLMLIAQQLLQLSGG
jgi:hypothetical protein